MIKISVVSYNNEAPSTPLSAIFGHDGGTIGRSDDNYFVLPDSKHYVSRLQASIKSDGTHHTIANLSKANPIFINKHEIEAEREYELHAGDEIQIGLYLLRAETLSAQVNGNGEHPESDITVAMPSPKAPNTLSLNQETIQVPAQHLNINLSVSVGGTATGVAGTAAAPVVVENTAPKAVPVEANHAEPNQATPIDPLMQAFLHGAGVPANAIAAELTPELMEMLGKLLATAIQGTIKLNASRAMVKKEVKADVTMVVVRNNNPLKFFPDVQTVLVQMLRKKMPGFLGPIEAMEEAMQDLYTHQMAVVAAMRTAANDTAGSFSPEYLETKLKGHSFLDSMIPANRKVKLWDLYTRRYHEAYVKAEDDTQTPFGKAFLRAYEKEIEKMQDEAHNE